MGTKGLSEQISFQKLRRISWASFSMSSSGQWKFPGTGKCSQNACLTTVRTTDFLLLNPSSPLDFSHKFWHMLKWSHSPVLQCGPTSVFSERQNCREAQQLAEVKSRENGLENSVFAGSWLWWRFNESAQRDMHSLNVFYYTEKKHKWYLFDLGVSLGAVAICQEQHFGLGIEF